MSWKPSSKTPAAPGKRAVGPVALPQSLNSHENAKLVPNTRNIDQSIDIAPAPRQTFPVSPSVAPMTPMASSSLVGSTTPMTTTTPKTRIKASSGTTGLSKLLLNQVREGTKTAEDLRFEMARKMINP